MVCFKQWQCWRYGYSKQVSLFWIRTNVYSIPKTISRDVSRSKYVQSRLLYSKLKQYLHYLHANPTSLSFLYWSPTTLWFLYASHLNFVYSYRDTIWPTTPSFLYVCPPTPQFLYLSPLTQPILYTDRNAQLFLCTCSTTPSFWYVSPLTLSLWDIVRESHS